MAYPRKIKDAARRLWLSGYSYEKVIIKLKKAFPKGEAPRRWQTIKDWQLKDGWKIDAQIIEQKSAKNREKETDEIVEAHRAKEIRDLETLDALLLHARAHIGKKDKAGKAQILGVAEIKALAQAINMIHSRERINRYGFDKTTKVDVNDTSDLSANPNANPDDGTLPASAEND